MSESSKKFLVTGATGKTGAYVVRQLLERGERVRALVHREDERSTNLAARGAEIVVADMLDLAAVTAATRDITAAYFTYPIVPGLLEATAILAQAAAESGVGAMVNMSQYNGRRPHRALQLQPPRSDRPAIDLTHERIKRRPVLRGLITEYERAA